jgi:hypothetical protein
MRTLALVLTVAMAWGLLGCGGGSKPPMQPDNDTGDAGPEPAPAPAPH